MNWLFEAKKRYDLSILNYTVTSNHIHLLAVDTDKNTIPRSIQLLAGRTAREYNIRKKRNGAFWEDRYHATVVQDGHHLLKCLIYIDMNMVRTGVVKHPSEWDYCGYHEILTPPQRYTVIDYDRLIWLGGYSDKEQFQAEYEAWINDEIKNDNLKRESYWTESIAVGDEQFIKGMKKAFSTNAIGRKIRSEDDNYMIQEELNSYNAVFDAEKCNLSAQNCYLWETFPENTNS